MQTNPAGSFALVGAGYCRGPQGNTQRVNGRAKAGLLNQAACASACTALDNCNGFAFVLDGDYKGDCWLYGKKLDEGLTKYAEPKSTTVWEGYTNPNFLVSAASGYSSAKCFKKGADTLCACTRACAYAQTLSRLDGPTYVHMHRPMHRWIDGRVHAQVGSF